MASSFFFYDLETSGFSPRNSRIMQFAGQRTDMSLRPIGQPVNHLIKMTPDVLPGPDAVMVTGITPQRTLAEGITEAEFLKIFHKEVVTPDTIFVGFNSIRFDDEFMRFLHYRNFYDAYEWQWKDGRSRWDLLDVVRMTRALRPDGIKWPFAPDGKPANRLELLAAVNKLEHGQAHDALSDVHATMGVARLVRDKQPDLFKYLLGIRGKKDVQELVEKRAPFIYTSGKYSSKYHHTTAAILLSKRPRGEVLVFDLRHDPAQFSDLSVEELIDRWRFTDDPDAPPRLPVKTLKYNRCPAIAPLGVIKDAATQERLGLSLETIDENRRCLQKVQKQFADKMAEVVKRKDLIREAEQGTLIDDELTVDSRLYGEDFVPDSDKALFPKVHVAKPETLGEFTDKFSDPRLKSLLPLYKARNFPSSLSAEESQVWDYFCARRLAAGDGLTKYFSRLNELLAGSLDDGQRYLVQELQLYGESVAPAEENGGAAD